MSLVGLKLLANLANVNLDEFKPGNAPRAAPGVPEMEIK
jgi:hypothetical protein